MTTAMTKTPIYIDALPKSIKTARAALFSNGGKTMTKVVLPIVAVVYGMVIALNCMGQGPTSLTVAGAYWVGGGSYVAGRANHYVVTKYGDEVLINSITTTEVE